MVAAPLFWLAAGMVRRDVGRALIAMRDDETAAQDDGREPRRLQDARVRAELGLRRASAGSLFVFANGFVAPESFTLTLSFSFLAAIVVGGLATVAGALFGALFIVFVPVWSSDVNDALSGVIYGAALIACMYVFRSGIMGLLRSAFARVVEVKGSTTGRIDDEVDEVAVAGAGRPCWRWCRRRAVVTTTRRRWWRRRRASADPGITDKEVKLGGSYPFSGPASAYGTIAKGAEAYFDFVNAKGGVGGRKINFKTIDDGYEPPRALQNAKRLIQQDKVFALFNTLGTPNNLAIWDYVNQQKVPHLFVATGASDWGKDIEAHPYTIGWQPNYVTEAKVYAEYLKKEKPNAKVAVLYQNDGFGKDLLGGFEEAIKGSGIKVVDKESLQRHRPDGRRRRSAGSRARGRTRS